LLMLIPFVLSRWGKALRKRSPCAREHMDDLEDDEKEAMNLPARTDSG
jgi:hypothetical protein